ncbi:MAG: GAF domain-containing protein [Chloroflexi bacterium]|nr:GAF domain-containing protein [Chloroflexota bacterium]
MLEENAKHAALRPQELEAVYAISRVVARMEDINTALDEIVQLARPVFIFDNLALYLQENEDPRLPRYARAIGRGRFLEADMAWGETIALEAVESGEKVIRKESVGNVEEDRNALRYYLGLPLTLGDRTMGALIFVRFGGPPYMPDQIHLAEFISDHVAQLLGHRELVGKIAELEAKRRLDDLQDDFIATVSHELLTPLGFIKGYATTLLRQDTTWDEETRREFLTIIDEEADRLRELIDNLMDSSRLQAGTLRINFQPLRLETLLRDIALRVGARNENMVIHLNLGVTGLQIQGDPTRLAQVFENLLTNAAKYAPDSPVTISVDTDGDRARIAVKDQGPGIPADHLPHLFKRFYRVPQKNSTSRGTGLGLYICRQIIPAHNGEITVDSTIGKGTTFYIYLPIDRSTKDGNTSQEVSS